MSIESLLTTIKNHPNNLSFFLKGNTANKESAVPNACEAENIEITIL